MSEKEKTVQILIPKDPQNPEYKVVLFKRDNVPFAVTRGKLTEVPEWVYKSAIQAGFIEE